MRLIIQNGSILTPKDRIGQGTVVVENGRFADIIPHPADSDLTNGRLLDATGLTIVPGFIDLQLNGGFAHDFTQNPSTIWAVADRLPQFGVTSFLPTIITSPLAQAKEAQAVLQAGRPAGTKGARPLGLHLEGPFLNPAKKGAHNPRFLQPPTLAAVQGWSPENGVRLVTLAPELPNGLALIETLTANGVVVSAGHSAASAAEGQASIAAGLRYGTHLFNAMVPLHHREPGLIGALLADKRVVVGLIPDGVHVAPLLLKLIWQLVGNGRLNLVTDSMAAMGHPPGHYQLGDYSVTVDAERAQLADGTLAGSIITMDEGVRRFIQMTGCSLAEAVETVTAVPAQLLNMAHHKGHIATGYDADFVLLTTNQQVAATFVAGEQIYTNPLYQQKLS
ncbi:MAG: N-acetylglucosamine-6-phosphate deacetylase [Chloroflexota bacterium]